MTRIQHIPLSPMSVDEWLWLYKGRGEDELPGSGAVMVDDDLPFEFDMQHSCLHGTIAHETPRGALGGCAFAAAGMVCVVTWLAFMAVCNAVVGWLGEAFNGSN